MGKPKCHHEPECIWLRCLGETIEQWSTACGAAFHFESNSTTPSDSNFHFCPNCGKRIRILT